ncbi:hypothetical protein [Flagellimonas allohymeniacidonis]|uniref:Beta-lactamase-inhibitor-like PepSY-like domain-containing protein n=1 Tax=Flagellimonas allohymeniacidonis TaxID=2517819 RepID=A0A4Q8QE70_9FLAO|nr:hypothetical protein [Allomuricauda hymeniacidonis]TAI47897.1 hypothetical protein EW142_14695 [Allomuricauda hymeniacidonis]
MRKLILAFVLSFVGFAAMAQAASVSDQTDKTAVIAPVQDFEEISVSDLPEAVVTAVSKDYPTASIDKAYKNASNQFKLELSLEDGTSGTVYADAEGNWIEM